MKKDLHPKDYRFVVFQDVSCNYSFLTRSTIATKETIKGARATSLKGKVL